MPFPCLEEDETQGYTPSPASSSCLSLLPGVVVIVVVVVVPLRDSFPPLDAPGVQSESKRCTCNQRQDTRLISGSSCSPRVDASARLRH